jgi:hypothetical protein
VAHRLLTHQQAHQQAQPSTPVERRPWWRRLMG